MYILNSLLTCILCISVLDVEAFERLLGPCMDLMKRNIEDYENELLRIFGSKANISDIRWSNPVVPPTNAITEANSVGRPLARNNKNIIIILN